VMIRAIAYRIVIRLRVKAVIHFGKCVCQPAIQSSARPATEQAVAYRLAIPLIAKLAMGWAIVFRLVTLICVRFVMEQVIVYQIAAVQIVSSATD
jgi:hypothetical protein